MLPNISRVTRSKTAARVSYNRLSRWYDLLAGSSEQKYRQLGLRQLNVRPGERVLEIGSGTGHSLLALADAAGPHGVIYGLDLSDGMTAVARNRITAAGRSSNISLLLGDAAYLPIAAATLDAIFMSFTLELFDTPEISPLLQQCYTCLRPGGRLAIVTLTLPPTPTIATRLYEWFHQRMPTIVDCRPILAQPALQAAGFTIPHVTALSMWGLPVEIILAQR